MARYLIVGGSGFLGVNLACHLARAGHAVAVCSRSISRHAAALHAAGVIQHQARLGDLAALRAIVLRMAPDAVIHMASGLIVADTDRAYRHERDEIVTPTWQLAEFLARCDIRLVYFSSGGAVYGEGDGGLLHEQMPCRPVSYYGLGKLEAEEAIRFVHRTRGLRHLIVRPSNPHGLLQRDDGRQGLIQVALRAVREASRLPVWGDGNSVRDYIHVDDLCHAMEALLAIDAAELTVNIGSGTGHSLLQVLEAVYRVTGHRVPLDFHPARSADVAHVVLDVGRLKALGAWRSRSLQSGLRACIAAPEHA